MSETVKVIELPLFPLDVVLFPGQVLPLHIFEDRYRLMIGRCLAEDRPFGVALIRQGREPGAPTTPHDVGTIARIIDTTRLASGALDIVTVGTERFRIRQLLFDQPYLRGEVEVLTLAASVDTEQLQRLTARVGELVQRYIKLVAHAAGLKIQIETMPDGPQHMGYLAAIAMQIENREKQALLVSDSVGQILADEMRLLRRENALLGWMVEHRGWPARVQIGPSGMLLPN
jgi:hypothetical protein